MGSKAKEGLVNLSCCHRPGSHPWELQPRVPPSQEEFSAPTAVWKGSRGCWRQSRTWCLCHIPRACPSRLTPLAVRERFSDTWAHHTGLKLRAQTPEPSPGSSSPPSTVLLLLQQVLHHARSSASAFCGCAEISPLAKLLVVVWALDYSLGPNI